MKPIMKSINEMKDSRILFDKQPPLFGYILILIVGIFFCITIFWSIKAPKVYTIQGQGVITNKEANYVMCTYTGEIDEYNMTEGMLVEKGDTLLTVKSTDYDLQEKQLLENKDFYESKISQNELLVKSIKDDINYFDETKVEDNLYYSSFEAYKSKVEQSNIDTSMFKGYGYTDEQIQVELIKNQAKIDEIYYTTIQSVESNIEQAKQQIASIEAQLLAISSGQDAYAVKAASSGVLHLLDDYKRGMVVQTGTTIATITPENLNRYVECYVSTADMARMHENDKVQIVVDGLSQSVYGNINGIVEQIDSNITMKQGKDGSTIQAFKVLISMDFDYMVSQNGDKVNIVNGMTAVARIQYDKITYFNYVLEKLGFKAK